MSEEIECPCGDESESNCRACQDLDLYDEMPDEVKEAIHEMIKIYYRGSTSTTTVEENDV